MGPSFLEINYAPFSERGAAARPAFNKQNPQTTTTQNNLTVPHFPWLRSYFPTDAQLFSIQAYQSAASVSLTGRRHRAIVNKKG